MTPPDDVAWQNQSTIWQVMKRDGTKQENAQFLLITLLIAPSPRDGATLVCIVRR
jgi:hypothetical protein